MELTTNFWRAFDTFDVLFIFDQAHNKLDVSNLDQIPSFGAEVGSSSSYLDLSRPVKPLWQSCARWSLRTFPACRGCPVWHPKFRGDFTYFIFHGGLCTWQRSSYFTWLWDNRWGLPRLMYSNGIYQCISPCNNSRPFTVHYMMISTYDAVHINTVWCSSIIDARMMMWRMTYMSSLYLLHFTQMMYVSQLNF